MCIFIQIQVTIIFDTIAHFSQSYFNQMKVKPNFLVWKFCENAVKTQWKRRCSKLCRNFGVSRSETFKTVFENWVSSGWIDRLFTTTWLADKASKGVNKILAKVTKIFQKYSLKISSKKRFLWFGEYKSILLLNSLVSWPVDVFFLFLFFWR